MPLENKNEVPGAFGAPTACNFYLSGDLRTLYQFPTHKDYWGFKKIISILTSPQERAELKTENKWIFS